MRGTSRLADWTPPYAWDPEQPNAAPPAFFTHPHWIAGTANNGRDDRHYDPLFPGQLPGDRSDQYVDPLADRKHLREELNTSHRVQQFQEREGMAPPTFRYTPDRDISHAPAGTEGSTTNSILVKQLQESHQFVQTMLHEREQKRTKTGR